MAFDFKYMNFATKHGRQDSNPIIKIYNCSKTAQASYMHLNKAAVESLGLKEDNYLKIGIDVETHKIVIVPSDNKQGRKLSKNPSGSGTVSISNLIEENRIPTQTCTANINRNYANGGLIFTYQT